MAGFIILTVLTIGAVLVYYSLPETKFNKAVELMESGNLELALEKFTALKEKHDKAIVKIAEVKFKMAESRLVSNNAENVIAEFQSILNLRKGLQRPTFDSNGLLEQENKAIEAINEIRYKSALELLKKGQLDLALTEFEKLKEKHRFAGLKIAEIKLLNAEKTLTHDVEKALVGFKDVLSVRKTLTSKFVDKVKFKNIEQKAMDAIAKIYYDKGQASYKKNELDSTINLFKEALKWSDSQPVKTNAIIGLAQVEYKKGILNEKQENLPKATSHYEAALTLIKEFFKDNFYYNLRSRIEICKLKEGKNPNESIVSTLANKNIDFKNDLMFRYALHLAKHDKIEECEKIINTHFAATNNRQVHNLRTFCQEYYKQKALEKMTLINEVIFGKKK